MSLTLEALEARENPAVVNPVAAQTAFQDLVTNVNAILTSPTPPSAVSLGVLVQTTFSALADEIVTPDEQVQIFRAASAVVAEANVSVDRLFAIVADIQIIRASIG